jgi:hypothetical protein
MTENKLLDNTLKLMGENGTLKAYEYLKANLSNDVEWSGQIYNFLYCLAATSGKTEEALVWLQEAVIEKGLWYRPEVFDDSDLDSIRGEAQFALCRDISLKKYTEALQTAATKFSWKEKLKDNLMVVLHGNQQNNEISRSYWDGLDLPGYQIEYLQSKELDSHNLYRWEDDGDGPEQLASALGSIEGIQYNTITLAGFSAGCNTILRSVVLGKISVNKIILIAPWIPMIQEEMVQTVECLKNSGIEVITICGRLDEDCLPHCKMFETKAKELSFVCENRYIDGLAHDYPEDFSDWAHNII